MFPSWNAIGGRHGPSDTLFALRKIIGFPMQSYCGRTDLKCMFCDKLDPIETAGAMQWAESPLAQPISEQAP